jgi:Flp pilus assembly protein TadG
MLVRKRKSEAGQATILLLVGLSIFLLGAVGLAIDGANLYANWQMAQAAADAAAQAGIMSVFYGTNTAGTHQFSTSSGFTCTSSDPKTPCYYAQTRNGFNTGSDTVTVDFPAIGDAAVGVNVSRSVSTTLLQFLGPAAQTVTARGVAAIEDIPSAIPIIVTHHTLTGALSFNGTPDITIIGGGRISVQVNSSDAASIANNSCGNATVDLHLAGPQGNGGDFDDFGGDGQSALTSPCFTFIPGTGKYVQPAGPIVDPLLGVDPLGAWITPSSLIQNQPSTGQTTPIALGTDGCVQIPGGPTSCVLYNPGQYPNGIEVKDSTSKGLALFAPGLYYISSSGFNIDSNGSAAMATGMSADPLYPEIGTSGMVVFNSGTGNSDIFSFSSNAGTKYPITLQGAPVGSRWDGILFMEDPYATGGSHAGIGAQKAHSIQGGGNITLTGTMYFSARTGETSTSYQALSVQGGSGSTTTLTGEIIAQALSLGGNGTIKMNLDSTTRTVRQVALVQ